LEKCLISHFVIPTLHLVIPAKEGIARWSVGMAMKF